MCWRVGDRGWLIGGDKWGWVEKESVDYMYKKFVNCMWLTIVGVRNLITLKMKGDLRDWYLRMPRNKCNWLSLLSM